MKPTLLLAVLCAALAACSAESTGPADPATDVPESAVTAPAATDQDAVRDALDRIAGSLEGPGAGRLRGALVQLLNADARGRGQALRAANDAIAALEQEGGEALAAELDAIRLALPAD